MIDKILIFYGGVLFGELITIVIQAFLNIAHDTDNDMEEAVKRND